MAPTTVLISGANRGLGKGLVERYLARDEHTIVAAVRDPSHPTSKALADLPTGQHSRLVVVKIDSTVETDALKAVEELSAQGIDRLDLVIANAGVARSFPKVSEVKAAELQAHITPNVFGVVWLYQATLPLLRKSAQPQWVTMGSSAGQLEGQAPIPNAAYAPSKAAVHWLTKRINAEEDALTAFVIHPGFVQTEMGNASARLVLGLEKAFVEVDNSCDGVVRVIDAATKDSHGGKLWDYEGKLLTCLTLQQYSQAPHIILQSKCRNTLWETNFTSTYHQKTYPSISPTRPELSAAGKTIFVSGGGRGLGIGIVKAFAAAGAAHIIILGRSTATLDEVAGRTRTSYPATKISTVSGDVSREEDVARAFASTGAEGVDVVVANAGYLPTVEPIRAGEGADFTEDWWKAWEVNVKGVFLLARQFLASAPPGGVFVNISAAAAHLNPGLPAFSGYAGSKLGAARLVETLQAENPSFRFYNVHPGVVESDMLIKSKLMERNPPTDEPDLAGQFVNWVASPEGEFLKGKYLWANWDVDELKARKEELSAPRKLVTGLVGWGA